MTSRSRVFLPLLGWLTLVVAACSKAPIAADATDPKVTGDRITFPANSPQLAALTVVPVEPRKAELHRMNARLVWSEEATVRIYSPVAGRVRAVEVALGDKVAKDAALAQLDSPDLGQAQADVVKAEADRLLAERALTREKDLFEHGAVARKDLEAAENGYASALSEKQRAASRLALYSSSSSSDVDGLFTLRTPLAGMVVDKTINLGQEVRSDQMLANMPQLSAPLFVVSDPSKLAILIDATERDLAVLHAGLPFTVRSSSFPDKKFEGRVDWISDALDPTTRRLTVRGAVENPERLLKAEMFVTIEFETPAMAGIAVPTQAVIMKGASHFVFVEEKAGIYARREIGVGPEQNDTILVTHGLANGERVVTNGSVLLDELQSSGGME